MKKSLFVLIFLFVLALTAASQAGTVISGLMKKDVTDPTDSIKVSGNYSTVEERMACYTSAKWTDISSHSYAPYEISECSANLFNNQVGWSTAKWYDNRLTPSATEPAYVTLQFPEAFVLTHFTISTGNDSMNSRNPTSWAMYGSNDGTNWNVIYKSSSNDTLANSTTTNQTILYSSFTYSDGKVTSGNILNDAQKQAVATSLGTGTTITTPDFSNSTPYSYYKLEVSKTNGGQTQLNELELYGNTSTVATTGNPFSGLNYLTNSLWQMDAQNADSLTVVEGTSYVSSWSDANGKDLVFSQTETTAQPSLVNIDVNGKTFQALKFSPKQSGETAVDHHGGDFMTLNASNTNIQTLFILAKNNSSAGLMGILGNSWDTGLRLGGTDRWQGGVAKDGNADSFGNGGEHYYNGTAETTSTPGLNGKLVLSEIIATESKEFDKTVLGSYCRFFEEGQRGCNSDILEVIAFDHALTNYESQLVNTSLALKYGLDLENTLDIFPGPVSSSKYKSEILGIVNKTFTDKNGSYTVSQFTSGDGGLGMAGAVIESGKVAASEFDIFLNSREQPTLGTEIYAVSNTDAAFGIQKNATGIKSSTYDVWEKEWYITNNSTNEEDWNLMMVFNADEAQFTDFETYKDEDWYLIFKTEEDGEYSRVADLGSQKFNENSISFTLPASLLQTGYYTLGVMTSPELPEPAAWMMILLGIAGIWKVKSGRR